MEQITSIKDPRVIEARELTSAAGRARLQKCQLEGTESIQWALAADWPIEYVFFASGQQQEPLFTTLRTQHIPCYSTSEGILKKISDTSYTIPCIGIARIPHTHRQTGPLENAGNFVIVLDRVQDHGNIGTIVRTASAFGIRDMLSTTTSFDPYYKKIISASRGRVFDMRWRSYPSGREAVAALKRAGFQVIATSSHARDIQSLVPLRPAAVALVVGNESEGISAEILREADRVVQIPMSGDVESLNVGVATGISLYELKFRMVLTMLTSYIRATLGRQVNATSQLIQRAFDVQIRQVSDLSSTQVILLMILKCDQIMTLDQVSRDTATSGDERTVLLQPLIEKGYIRQYDETSIVLTEEGEQALARLWNVVERAEHKVLAGFSESEKTQFNDLLNRIQHNCMRIIGEQ